MHDVPNLDREDPCITIDHPEVENNIQQEFGIGDHGEELNMADAVSDPIDVAIDIDLIVTTNIELQSILSESVKESIHFLAIEEEVPTEEADEERIRRHAKSILVPMSQHGRFDVAT
ncbi:hypothetical protein PVK06_001695 [Gossypium arboreum]|uniref:Uncharacterized protein n=1 Tax=Gossypium arboreum TaxID=29729 RepID=A0ABR0R1V2_GOSAR|nr:hypothetical protein PVK06_001695 [Gossypium arboreum]